ncbi:MAG: hypothetical protein JW759_00110 [Candidatus Coatesbacteria bacterium]|nr:hypothetical protein [Candidatus Coatesbacteria bacterium]
MRKDYHIGIFYSDGNGVNIVGIQDGKPCSPFGETPEDALRLVLGR